MSTRDQIFSGLLAFTPQTAAVLLDHPAHDGVTGSRSRGPSGVTILPEQSPLLPFTDSSGATLLMATITARGPAAVPASMVSAASFSCEAR
ncbi:hypothetical protein [Acetobacter conturbans]|uniref:Uncharacterized protein n=1 Tax=Acetobacter conturbans TaxID=1737472 RepID=A0ABX0JXQ7_9PROT|nr:hypothetical protein [Acetobacter conturbans]NHN88073.1 hypothetical protein [Acetobacter conturbans]